MTRNTYSSFNDNALSLICGLALLLAVRAAYDVGVGYLPDTLLISGVDPMTRLALARFVLFAVIVTPLALILSWPLARHAVRRDLVVAMPGASCAAVLFALMEQWLPFDPFPMWFTVARAIFLFAIFPAALLMWWRLLR
ncbi:MAG: hypothetical protein KY410_04910 [Proteobacteria bacterium]|nr:hypothetical protein [Pseudomonadota bacterium]